jgi:hypothetical protein
VLLATKRLQFREHYAAQQSEKQSWRALKQPLTMTERTVSMDEGTETT